MLKPHQRVYGIFFIFALSMGALLSRLPDLQISLGLTESELGLTLISMSLGALCGLTFSSPIIERLGARTTAFVTVIGASTMYAIIPWVTEPLLLPPVFFIAGILAGALEINVNLETDRHEAQLGFRIMSRAHGMWSLGFFVIAFISAGVRQAGISVHVHTFVALLVVIVLSIIVFSKIENAPARRESHAGEVPRIAFPTLGLLPLCLIGAAPLLAEGAGIDWSGIYLRNVFAVEPFIGTLGVTLFSLSMAIARLSMDPVVDRFGPRWVAGSLLAIAGLGVLLVWLAPHAYVALCGFLLMGLGASSVYPLAVSAAAQRTDRPASVNVASLGQMTFTVFFLGPPLLGFIGEHFGNRAIYLAVLPLLLAALLFIRGLPAHGTVDEALPEPATPHG